jgi:RNA polymerase sigma-70 factor (ECF subfamily)
MDRMATDSPPAAVSDETETHRLVQQAAGGDQQAWTLLLSRHRDRLSRMVAMRLDRRLQGRIDPSDVVQEACAVAAKQISAYAANPAMPFYLWLRWLTSQRLIDQHRRHLGAEARRANREIAHTCGKFAETASADLAAQLIEDLSSPSQKAIRVEQTIQLHEALLSLDPLDREILAMRHFEQLSNGEAAGVLGLDKSAASKRYARALVRLRDLLLPQLSDDV